MAGRQLAWEKGGQGDGDVTDRRKSYRDLRPEYSSSQQSGVLGVQGSGCGLLLSRCWGEGYKTECGSLLPCRHWGCEAQGGGLLPCRLGQERKAKEQASHVGRE